VVDPLVGEDRGLFLGEDAEAGVDLDVGLVADQSDGPEDVFPLVGPVCFRDAFLGEDDPEALCTVGLGAFRGREDRLGVEEAVGVDPGVEVDRLGTEPAVLGAVPRLRVDNRTRVDGAVTE